MRTISGLRFTLLLGAACTTISCARMNAPQPPSENDWPGYAGHDDAHYSPLRAINQDNVQRLGLAWFHDIDVGGASNTKPIAVGGMLYFAAGYSVVHALDARTGKLIWKYDPEAWKVAGERMRVSWGSRGMAHAGGKLFVGTVDGRLLALNARNGKLLWSAVTVHPMDGRYITAAPWIAGNNVIIGHGGADFAPVRGYVTAYDIDTGKQSWRFHTVPGDPSLGFENAAMARAAETWTGEWWKRGGGGTVWNAMAYDSRRDLLFIGTGNGAPWNHKIRSPGGGDNLFLCSIIALRASTGEYVWHYQVNPGETWDYNAAMDIEMAELVIHGRKREVLLHAPKNGFFYVLDRGTGELLSVGQFARTVNWATSIDLKTGRPVENPAARYPHGSAALVFPSSEGAHTAEPMAFNPISGLAYINAIDQGRVFIDPSTPLATWRHQPGMQPNTGLGAAPAGMKSPSMTNELVAWNPTTQQAAWRLTLPGARNGGIATTGGNLVIQGQVTGQFAIYSTDRGDLLWSFQAPTGIIASPISYMADGRQYITVIAGWRGTGPSGLPQEWDYSQQQWRVLAFALDGNAKLPASRPAGRPVLAARRFAVDADKANRGERLYNKHCFLCHGRDAIAAGMAPDLRKSAIPLSQPAFSSIVRDGALLSRGMPAFPELDGPAMDSLAHFIGRQADLALTDSSAAP